MAQAALLDQAASDPLAPAKGPLANDNKAPSDVAAGNLDKAISEEPGKLAAIDTQEAGEEKKHLGLLDGKAPPPLQQVPQPTPKTTDPQQVWSSAAMMLAVFGSLLTRQPLTTAMSSAAAALTAFHKGDQEAFDTAFKSWQVANKNAIDLYEFQSKEYDRILSQVDHLDSLSQREAESKKREITGEITALNAVYGHKVMQQVMKDNGLNGARRFQLDLDKFHAKQVDATPTVIEHADASAALAELHKTPEWMAADAQKRLQMDHAVLKQTSPSMAKAQREEFDKQTKRIMTAIDVQIAQTKTQATRIKTGMANYKASKGGTVPADDPTWAIMSRDLAQAEAKNGNAEAAKGKVAEIRLERESKDDDDHTEAAKYASLSDLQQAFTNGQVSQADAVKIAKDNGWAQ